MIQEHPALTAVRGKLKSLETPFTLLVSYTIKPGTESEFAVEANAAAIETRKEPGNIAYEFHLGTEDPTKILLFEKWQDFAALAHHFTLPHTHTILSKMGEIAASPLELEVYEPLAK